MPSTEALRRLAVARKVRLEFQQEFPELFPSDVTQMKSRTADMLGGQAEDFAASALFEYRDISSYYEWTRTCGLASLAAKRNARPGECECFGSIYLRRIAVVLAGAHFELAKMVAQDVVRPVPSDPADRGLKYQQLLATAWADLAEERWIDLDVSAERAITFMPEEETDRTGVLRAMLCLRALDRSGFEQAVGHALCEHRKLCGGRREYAESPADHLICWEVVALLQVARRRGMRIDVEDELVPEGVLRV